MSITWMCVEQNTHAFGFNRRDHVPYHIPFRSMARKPMIHFGAGPQAVHIGMPGSEYNIFDPHCMQVFSKARCIESVSQLIQAGWNGTVWIDCCRVSSSTPDIVNEKSILHLLKVLNSRLLSANSRWIVQRPQLSAKGNLSTEF
jgi:hypothetical protein